MYAKKKIKTKKPPLSWLDKFIYNMLILLVSVGIMLGWFLLLITVPEKVAFSDPAVIAYRSDAFALCSLPLLIVLFLVTFVFAHGYQKKQPIFGNKKFKTIGFQPMIKVYPIFSKAFRENLTDKTKRMVKKIFTAWMICFVVSVLILLLGIYPREVFDKQNNFSRYNSFNQVTSMEHIEEAKNLVINIRTKRGHRSFESYRYIELGFVFEEHTYWLNIGSFREADRETVLEHMLHLKSFFKAREYEVRNMDQFEKLLQEEKFNARETELVYELFDYTDE